MEAYTGKILQSLSFIWKGGFDHTNGNGNFIQIETPGKWKPHTGGNPIQMETPYRWKPHTDGNPMQMETHTNGNRIQMKTLCKPKTHS
jgi:hypothetical protein